MLAKKTAAGLTCLYTINMAVDLTGQQYNITVGFERSTIIWQQV